MSSQFEIATQLARMFGETTPPITDVSAKNSTPESRERNRAKKRKEKEEQKKGKKDRFDIG